MDVLLENGIRSLELTLTTKGALEVVERLAAKVPDGTDLGAESRTSRSAWHASVCGPPGSGASATIRSAT